MNYLPATIRSTLSPATPFFKVSQPTLLPHLIKAAAAKNMGLFFSTRHISGRTKATAPLTWSTTSPSTSGSSNSHSSFNDGNQAQKSKLDAHHRPLPSPSVGVKSVVSIDDITRRGLRRLLHLTEACKLIEEEAHRNGQVLLDHMKEGSQQETNTALGQQGSTPEEQKEIRLLSGERERERREQIMRKSLADVLKNWGLSEEGYVRLKQARRMRNELVHPVLRREDAAVILRDWKREGGQDDSGQGDMSTGP
ncbi:hypothetical protein BGX30_011571 [Mortierella sp. GBA39]|nr:hypothetical protein BGX30_011571 [Mortierella sp. GBA39]